MAQHYSDPKRASEPTALPNLEIWHHDCARHGSEDAPITDGGPEDTDGECHGPGWYWWSCFPGCLPDGDPSGPFATEAEALADAREGVED